MENLDAPKKWFKANVDTILKSFGAEHRIQKEDLVLGLSPSRFVSLWGVLILELLAFSYWDAQD
jgi:hypothetical protein